VGTLDAYRAANIDLIHATPSLDLYETARTIWINAEITPPAKVIQGPGRRGELVNSTISILLANSSYWDRSHHELGECGLPCSCERRASKPSP
jgi:hypothetical protein